MSPFYLRHRLLYNRRRTCVIKYHFCGSVDIFHHYIRDLHMLFIFTIFFFISVVIFVSLFCFNFCVCICFLFLFSCILFCLSLCLCVLFTFCCYFWFSALLYLFCFVVLHFLLFLHTKNKKHTNFAIAVFYCFC